MAKELDWPPVAGTSERAWQVAVTSFFASHMKFVEAIKKFSDERLEATVPGRTYNFYQLFQSMTQHAVYHAGTDCIAEEDGCIKTVPRRVVRSRRLL